MLNLGDTNCFLTFICVFSTAKKFGVTEFVNPKDHNKPVQEVSDKRESCSERLASANPLRLS
jgi:hypothetical protein